MLNISRDVSGRLRLGLSLATIYFLNIMKISVIYMSNSWNIRPWNIQLVYSKEAPLFICHNNLLLDNPIQDIFLYCNLEREGIDLWTPEAQSII